MWLSLIITYISRKRSCRDCRSSFSSLLHICYSVASFPLETREIPHKVLGESTTSMPNGRSTLYPNRSYLLVVPVFFDRSYTYLTVVHSLSYARWVKMFFLPLVRQLNVLFVEMTNLHLWTLLHSVVAILSAMNVGVSVYCISLCWKPIYILLGTHLAMKINEGEPEMHCLHHKCNTHVPDNFIRQLVTPAVFDKYPLLSCVLRF